MNEELEKALTSLGLDPEKFKGKVKKDVKTDDTLIKGLAEALRPLLIKEEDDSLKGELSKAVSLFETVTTELSSIKEGLADISELRKGLDSLSEAVKKLEDTPNDRKAISSKTFVEKGKVEDDEIPTVSVSKDKALLLSALDKYSGSLEKGTDNEFNKAAVQLEAGGYLSPDMIAKLEKLEGCKIVL